MRMLLDTCVLSEIRKPHGHPGVKEAVENLKSSDLFISVITIGEIAKRHHLTERK
jgi:predicted nucleic acid-binding protein